MTQEEKANAYDEALGKARRYYDEYKTRDNILYVEDMEDMFPELKESEDESIRKWIIGVLSTYEHDRDLRNAAIAYLEKQGEQKPTIEMITPEESLGIDSETYNKIVDECIYSEQKPAWSEEDEEIVEALNDYVKNLDIFFSEIKIGDKNTLSKEFREKVQLWLKSLKDRVQPQPKQEWSEEDKRNLNDAILFIKTGTYSLDKDNLINWLKSLRPQNTWEPSKEQIKICKEVYADILSAKGFDFGTVNSELNRLEEELKKLKG